MALTAFAVTPVLTTFLTPLRHRQTALEVE
jgi:hypothetical protein